MKELLEHIESLKKSFAELQPLSPENQQKLDKKLRLEWNYNSNHIEGNTLTYGETELLLIFGETKGNHEFREYEEMRGHDVALRLIEDLAFDKERDLTENLIREINKAILKEPFYKEAITPDGQATRRLIKIGEYKSFPNSVRLQNGEIFNYASPAETPALMNDLLTWYQEASQNNDLHPGEIAAELHYRFVCIHLFDDGNGRISRLLMNYHLIKNGYPPVIIKTGDKKNYLFALHEADTGNIIAFKEYIAEQLIWSYEISIKAAKGESINEPGDWEKKFSILEKEIISENSLKEKKGPESIKTVLLQVARPISHFLLKDFDKINTMFFESEISLKANGITLANRSKKIEDLDSTIINFLDARVLAELSSFEIDYYLGDFKHNGLKSFDIVYSIVFIFHKLNYTINIKHNPSFLVIQKPYHQFIDKNELDKFINDLSDLIIRDIQKNKK